MRLRATRACALATPPCRDIACGWVSTLQRASAALGMPDAPAKGRRPFSLGVAVTSAAHVFASWAGTALCGTTLGFAPAASFPFLRPLHISQLLLALAVNAFCAFGAVAAGILAVLRGVAWRCGTLASAALKKLLSRELELFASVLGMCLRQAQEREQGAVGRSSRWHSVRVDAS